MRKFAQAGGWKYIVRPLTGKLDWRRPNGHWYHELPFPNDLAACFEVLERVCEPDNPANEGFHKGWSIHKSAQPLHYRCTIGLRFNTPKCDTKQEAIISAVLSAVEVSNK